VNKGLKAVYGSRLYCSRQQAEQQEKMEADWKIHGVFR